MTSLERLLSQTNRVAVDTAPLIYFVEQHPSYLETVRPIFRAISNGELSGVTSTLTLTELLVHPLDKGRPDLASRYRTLLEKSDHFELASISAAIGTRAAQIRADFGFRTPDALQLATAVVRECDIFLTNDQQLTQYNHVETVLVSDIDPLG